MGKGGPSWAGNSLLFHRLLSHVSTPRRSGWPRGRAPYASEEELQPTHRQQGHVVGLRGASTAPCSLPRIVELAM